MANELFFLLEETVAGLWASFRGVLPSILFVAIPLLVILAAYFLLTRLIDAALRTAVKGKQERQHILKFWRYGYLFIALLVLIVSFSGGITAAGISIGLLSAALGWALQKPITGIAAWLMILIKRPFKVGDRVIVDNIKGDIQDITLFYIVLNEFGGTIGGEDSSGRTIMIPTSILFEKPITNYTLGDAYILDEVGAEFTYESSLPKVEGILVAAAKKFTADAADAKSKEPFTRVFFNPSGMKVKVRYYVLAKDRQQVMTDITREIYNNVIKTKGTEFAYPHAEVLLRHKK